MSIIKGTCKIFSLFFAVHHKPASNVPAPAKISTGPRLGAGRTTKSALICSLVGLLLSSCGAASIGSLPDRPPEPLSVVRKRFHTKLASQDKSNEPVPIPPAGVFEVVSYPSQVGNLVAYITAPPGDHQRHPAIVWITGGDCNTIGDVWTAVDASNDQSASAYRQAGIVMMFPSLRGGNTNPGNKEGFLGEVDDVLAAADYLRKCPYVDPNRIYLGGHSSGGTLALLVAESTDKFRAVFSFGPVSDVRCYEYTNLFPFIRFDDAEEVSVRSPGLWLSDIKSPAYVFEGTDEQSNIGQLEKMRASCNNSFVHFKPIVGKNHFSDLAPTNSILAAEIVRDTADTPADFSNF